MNKIQLTQEGHTKLQEELEELTTVKRPQAVERLSKARSMGDLKENSEYSAAKEELSFVEGRVQEIEALLKNAEIVANQVSGQDVVSLGKKVTVDAGGNKNEFTIVGEYEADLTQGKLSSSSPIGKALLGKRKGESLEVKIPAGRVTYKILDVN